MNISVVIPTYNRYEVLKRAINSVLAQTYVAKEIIVIDDGSNDETLKIKEEFPNIKYFYQDNSGVSSARNLGITKSTCEWIAFLDSDDIWSTDKLNSHVEFHKHNKNILMSYTDERWVRNGVEVNIPKKYKKYGGHIFKNCLSHCIIAPSATLIHKNLLDKVGLFDEKLEVCEDYDLWLRVAIEHEIGFIDKKYITKHGGDNDQLSMKFWGMDRYRVRSLEKLLKHNNSKKELIVECLIKKYSLLLKGALKYDKISSIDEYKNKIMELNR